VGLVVASVASLDGNGWMVVEMYDRELHGLAVLSAMPQELAQLELRMLKLQMQPTGPSRGGSAF
jgi:hypothetical protein